jgi:DNA-binding NarL/FixJ family response regulator
MNTERISVIFELRKQGKTFREIGDHLGVSRQMVNKLFIDSGLDDPFPIKQATPKPAKIPIVEQHKDEVIKLYNEGLTLPEIACQLFGEDKPYKTAISYYLVKWGVANRRTCVVIQTILDNKEQVVEWYDNGMTIRDIEFNLGLSGKATNLYPLLKKWGVKLRRPRK